MTQGSLALDVVVAVCAFANYFVLWRWHDGVEAFVKGHGAWFLIAAALAIAGLGCGVAYVGGRVDPMFPSGTNIWMWPLVIVGAGLSAAAIARLAGMIPDRGR